MLKNSCFFIICRSYLSLPRACIHRGNVFFRYVRGYIHRENVFFRCVQGASIAKKIFSEDFALLLRNIHSRSNSSRVLSTLLSCCLPKL